MVIDSSKPYFGSKMTILELNLESAIVRILWFFDTLSQNNCSEATVTILFNKTIGDLLHRPAYAKWWIYQPAIYYNGKISLLVGKSIGCTGIPYVLGHFSSLEDCKSSQKHGSCIILLNEKKALLSPEIEPWTFHT